MADKVPAPKQETKAPTTKGQLDKTNSAILVAITVATVVLVFCLVSAKTLLSQAGYQNRLLSARHATLSQLIADKSTATTLTNNYTNTFEGTSATNIIGGKNTTSKSAVPPDGDNASIVLDSLPTAYDFPALVSSVTKILNNNSVSNPSLSGTDDSSTANNTPSGSPVPTPISISVGGQVGYSGLQNMIKDFERSTRPFDVTDLQLSGNQSFMTFSIKLTTYYQPAKAFMVSSKEVR